MRIRVAPLASRGRSVHMRARVDLIFRNAPVLRFGLPDHLTTPGPANGPANLRRSGKWSRAPCRDRRGQAWAVRQVVRQTICM